ncbi:alcohol dehydrogenase [Siphonobacter sp. SORGH_AS_0500]|nr:L-iditol 2-dehydrogenase [Siphonobacter sp. SORGH_AS_0500]PKK34987.1 alcohol dehydrogenase [Siphonobacter sp. SORGH_AS_0500]
MDHQMKAALKTAKGDFEVTDVDRPKIPKPDWVLARVRVAGICGTDLRHWKKEEPELVHKIMGHELAGEVIEVGSEVTNVKPGDRVVIETVLGDDTCDWCKVQQYNLCPHLYEVRMETVSRAFAAYVVGPAKKFYKLPDHVSFEEATLLDTFSVCMHAIQLSGIKINDTVAVIGAGPIGLGQLQLAKACGADVIVTDIVESSLDLARELGADLVINSQKEDAYQKVMEFTHNRGVDIAFECAGGPSIATTIAQATTFTRIGGKVLMVGGFDPGTTPLELEWQRIQMSEIKLIPSASYAYWGIYPEMQMCLDLLAKGKLNAEKLITHRFSLDAINEAFETAQDKQKTHAVFVALTI